MVLKMVFKVEKFLGFLENVNKLKSLCRTGWLLRGIVNAETVGAHSWGMALMALKKEKELRKLNVNMLRIIEMCLLHDVGECVVGDIIPEEHQVDKIIISNIEKKNKEFEAINYLASYYNFNKLKDVFIEYEEQKTLEAIVVKNLDKLDMLLQAYEYILEYNNSSLNEFMEFNEKNVTLDIFREDLNEIKLRQYEKKCKENEFIDFQLNERVLKNKVRDEMGDTYASHCFECGIIALYLEDELKKLGFDIEKILKYLIVKNLDSKLVLDYKISEDEKIILNDIEVFENICTLKVKDKSNTKITYYKDLIKSNLFLKLIN